MTNKQNALPTILLIEQDQQTLPLLNINLCNWGYRVIVAVDQEDALARIDDKRNSPDLILLNQVGLSIDEYLNIGRHIRQSIGISKQIPIIVMAERYQKDMEGKNVSVGESEYVTYLEDGEQLMKLLDHLISSPAK